MTYALCLHRWVGNQALYGDYPRPPGCRLHFLATREAVASLPAGVSLDVVESLDDIAAVSQEVEQILALHGPPVQVIALNEGDLLTAAVLRERLGLAGDHRTDVEPFRDKLRMAEVAAGQLGVRVLPTAAVDAGAQRLLKEVGLPLVVKPRYGTASRGVRVLRTTDEVRRHVGHEPEPMIAQAFCAAPTRHLDGWWDGTRIVVGTASVYTSNCSEFGPDLALGSFELPPGPEEDRLMTAAAGILAAFAPSRELVFHLELFDDGDELTFLEIGARAGGAEIPFIWRELRGIDLLGIAWELQTGWSQRFRDRARHAGRNGRTRGTERGGWLLAQGIDDKAYPPTCATSLTASQPKVSTRERTCGSGCAVRVPRSVAMSARWPPRCRTRTTNGVGSDEDSCHHWG